MERRLVRSCFYKLNDVVKCCNNALCDTSNTKIYEVYALMLVPAPADQLCVPEIRVIYSLRAKKHN